MSVFTLIEKKRLIDSIRNMTSKFEHSIMYFDDGFTYFDAYENEHMILYITDGYNPHIGVDDKVCTLGDLNLPMLTMLNYKIEKELKLFADR